jgi:hypothetical protein
MTAETTIETNALQAAEPTEVGTLALMTLKPEAYAAEVYQPFKTRLAAAIESVRNIDYDITTTKGLEVVTKARRTMMDIRIEANKQREARKAPIIQIGKLLESSYKAVEENVLPLETFFDGEIKAEEGRKEAEKQAKIAMERARVEEITERIAAFGKLATASAGKGSADIAYLQAELEALEVTEELFEDFISQARIAKADAATGLQVAYEAASRTEQAIEAERIKREEEDRQRAAEAAENAKQKAELDRVAAEQAAERKRLDDAAEAQRVELARAQKEADDKIKAAAATETARIQAEADARAREHALAMKELEEKRAAFEAEQAAAQKVKDDAAQLEADHVEALAINAAMDTPFTTDSDPDPIEALAVTINAGAIADALIADALDLAPLHEAVNEPTDEEIIAVYMDEFGGTMEQAIARLKRFNA